MVEFFLAGSFSCFSGTTFTVATIMEQLYEIELKEAGHWTKPDTVLYQHSPIYMLSKIISNKVTILMITKYYERDQRKI